MRDSADYYNLLTDTFRSSYLQVVKIYDKIPEALAQNKLINIRTGYLMKPRSHDCNFYENSSKYPLCWNFDCGAYANFSVINKIFKVYESWLDEYDKSKDEKKIKEIINKEVQKAQADFENNKKLGKDDYELFQNSEDDEENSEEIEENDNEQNDEALSDFIVNDENVEEDEEENEYEEEFKEKNEENRSETEPEKFDNLDQLLDNNEETKEVPSCKILRKKRNRIIDDEEKIVDESSQEWEIVVEKEDSYDEVSNTNCSSNKKRNIIDDD